MPHPDDFKGCETAVGLECNKGFNCIKEGTSCRHMNERERWEKEWQEKLTSTRSTTGTLSLENVKYEAHGNTKFDTTAGDLDGDGKYSKDEYINYFKQYKQERTKNNHCSPNYKIVSALPEDQQQELYRTCGLLENEAACKANTQCWFNFVETPATGP